MSWTISTIEVISFDDFSHCLFVCPSVIYTDSFSVGLLALLSMPRYVCVKVVRVGTKS